jgi:hypothetical protein
MAHLVIWVAKKLDYSPEDVLGMYENSEKENA